MSESNPTINELEARYQEALKRARQAEQIKLEIDQKISTVHNEEMEQARARIAERTKDLEQQRADARGESFRLWHEEHVAEAALNTAKWDGEYSLGTVLVEWESGSKWAERDFTPTERRGVLKIYDPELKSLTRPNSSLSNGAPCVHLFTKTGSPSKTCLFYSPNRRNWLPEGIEHPKAKKAVES